MTQPSIGFIGLGLMGRAMVQRLEHTGHGSFHRADIAAQAKPYGIGGFTPAARQP